MVVTTVIWLVFVACALRPPFRRGALGFTVFLLTSAMNEIPLLLLVVFAVSVASTDAPVGSLSTVVSAILSALVAAGLIRLQVRARTARTALEAALDRSLGTDWKAVRRNDGGRGQLRNTPWWQGVVFALQRHTNGVERTRNVSYGPDAAHRVDVYRGSRAGTSQRIVIHLHGGGFAHGGKSRESGAMLNHLAKRGWICLSADYRLGAAGRHPHSLVDVKRLIAWIRAHHAEYGADGSQVFLAGCSAGANLAVCAALTADVVELQPGFEAADAGVNGVVVLYGYVGPRSSAPSSSPVLLARADAPPMLFVHGSNDTALPADSTRRVAQALALKSGQPVVFAELPHTQHSFDLFASVRSRLTADAVEAFLDWASVADRAAGQQTSRAVNPSALGVSDGS